jgi:hypothetical protein
MSAQKGIGRIVQFGIAKETLRGTAPTTPAYFLAWNSGIIEEKYENVTDVESYGVIEDSANVTRVKNYAEANLKMPLTDTSLGLFLYSLFGGYAVAAQASPNAAVYNHTFTVLENAQHQSIACYVHDPLAAQDYSHANGVVSKLDIDFALKKFIEITAVIKTLAGTQITTLTPAQATENRFLPQNVTFKTATTVAGLSGATPIAIKSLKLTFNQNIEDQEVLGNVAPKDFLTKEFMVEGTVEAIFQNESDFKTASLANTIQAMLIDIKNTNVTIGSSSNPELKITLDQCFFTEISVNRTLKEIVYQTVKFKATYSIANAEMAKAVLSNLVATY